MLEASAPAAIERWAPFWRAKDARPDRKLNSPATSCPSHLHALTCPLVRAHQVRGLATLIHPDTCQVGSWVRIKGGTASSRRSTHITPTSSSSPQRGAQRCAQMRIFRRAADIQPIAAWPTRVDSFHRDGMSTARSSLIGYAFL